MRLGPWKSLLLAAFFFAPSANAFEGSARATGGLGVDSNPSRDYQQRTTVKADAFLSGVMALQGQDSSHGAEFLGSYDLGARKFFSLSSEDVLIQTAFVQASLAPATPWVIGLQGRAKDRRGGERAYTDLFGAAFTEVSLSPALRLRAHVGGHRFLYRPFFPYSFRAIELGLQALYRFDQHHSLYASGEVGWRSYNDEAASFLQRQDTATSASMGYRYRGPFSFTGSYGYTKLDSNNFGESIRRHHLGASAGFRLPFELTLLLEGSLQLTDYPDKVYGSPDIALINDESLNSLVFRLVRTLSRHFDLEVQFALYRSQLPGPNVTYTYDREVGSIGLTWRL